MTMAEWKEFNASEEELVEIWNSNDVLIRCSNGFERLKSQIFTGDFDEYIPTVTHYLICEPHPYADMIKRWADTGQPVYARSMSGSGSQLCHEYFPPFAHPDKFEYSFTPFGN
jgi:hypothetical protein